jgi:hypothetical protein
MAALLAFLFALRHCFVTGTIVLLDLAHLVTIGLRSRRALAAENLFLRKQLAVVRNKSALRHILLEAIFVMEAADYLGLGYAIPGRQSMSMAAYRNRCLKRFRQSGSQRSVRPAPVVVGREFRKNAL